MTASGLADYTTEVPCAVGPERVFAALTTPEGLAGWWTSRVSGDPTAGGRFELAFAGLQERIVMRVDDATPASSVVWTCLLHTGHPEWRDTRIVFGLGPGAVRFRHVGLTPQLECRETCERGWERFLVSLVTYARDGVGSPF
jgi:uncharacterized protein YndB with AHSA1/START domain